MGVLLSADKISVVIPTYNRAEYLGRAIDSVLSQTHRDLEIIVVDDNSTDNTAEIISSYGPRIKYILQENKERGAARNQGIKNSDSEYIAFLDSDDEWLPDHLERCLSAFLSCSGAGAAYSGSYIIDEDERIVGRLPASAFHGDPLREIVSGFSSRGCNATSSLVKREVFEKAGYFSEIRELSGSEDWEMWVRMASHADIVFSGAYTAKVRFHPGKSSADPSRMAHSMKLAMDTVFANEKLLPRISALKRRAYSSLYVIIAVNYYAAGNMKEARHNLAMAVRSYPASVVLNPLLSYTYLRSLLGRNISLVVRRVKWGLNTKLLK